MWPEKKLELLTMSFGIGLIILGILRSFEVVNITSQFITGVSLASFFLTFPDFVDVYEELSFKLTHNGNLRWLRALNYYRIPKSMITKLCYILSMMSILIFPFLEPLHTVDPAIMSRIGDASTFIALGFSIYVTSARTKIAALNYINELGNTIRSMIGNTFTNPPYPINPSEDYPNWPLDSLPGVAEFIDGQLRKAQEDYTNLLEAGKKPYVLEDYMVHRVIELYAEDPEGIVQLFKKQLEKWQKEANLTPDQQNEVKRLQKQVSQWEQVITDILKLANELLNDKTDIY